MYRIGLDPTSSIHADPPAAIDSMSFSAGRKVEDLPPLYKKLSLVGRRTFEQRVAEYLDANIYTSELPDDLSRHLKLTYPTDYASHGLPLLKSAIETLTKDKRESTATDDDANSDISSQHTEMVDVILPSETSSSLDTVPAKPAPPKPDPRGFNIMNNALRQFYNPSATPPAVSPAVSTAVSPAAAPSSTLIAKKTIVLQSSSKKTKRANMGASHQEESFNTPETSLPTAKYSDLGGIANILEDIRELVELPIRHPEIYAHLGIDPPRGVLFSGPPGTGKTTLANAIAGELQVPFFKISAPEIVSGMSGESEAKIRTLFQSARDKAPCLVFIDEIDAITPKRENAQREMERRIVAQLLTSLDDLHPKHTDGNPVIVIGATNRPDSLDSALRRAGRFDREISLGIPDRDARKNILTLKAGRLRVDGELDFDELARLTPGYVGADLEALIREASTIAIKRILKFVDTADVEAPSSSNVDANNSAAGTSECTVASPLLPPPGSKTQKFTPEQLAPLCVSMSDFLLAVKKVQPSAKREGFATIPNVTWDSVGALSAIRSELKMAIIEPIRFPGRFKALGIEPSAGVLLYGPPGNGKTLLAKAIANESGASFISVKGPELLNKYVGESERAIRTVFARAMSSSPCIIFFDELDSLCPKRGGDGSSASSERVVNQLLTEMDGLEKRESIFVIGATNRPDIIDPAMLRPGRLDKVLYVGLPSPEERFSILRTLTRFMPLSSTLDLEKIATDARCDFFSGADLAALARDAACTALKRYTVDYDTDPNMPATEESIPQEEQEAMEIYQEDFDMALNRVFPSVSPSDRQVYQQMRNTHRGPTAADFSPHQQGQQQRLNAISSSFDLSYSKKKKKKANN